MPTLKGHMLELGHLLTRSRKLMVSPVFFCRLVCSILSVLSNLLRAFCLYVATSFFCIPVFCPKLGLYLVVLQSVFVL